VTTASARALLTGLVDYAGLFPPAGLSMKEAVAEYARHHGEAEAWMLGRFVVPAARLDELEEAMVDPAGSIREDALGTTPGGRSLSAEVVAFNTRHAGRAHIDSVEFRAFTRAELEAALDTIPDGLTVFVELPLDDLFDELLTIVKARGAHAKIRTGGVVAEAIPEPGPVARFLEACAAAGVPLKATAGLHHPVRAEHPLTYEAGAPRRTMHGFLNVFGAAVLAQGGMTKAEIETVLLEADPAAFRFDDEGFSWQDRRSTTDEIARSRQGFATSFGACSFAEPVADLQALGVIS
jgi:hypothetical protein